MQQEVKLETAHQLKHNI